MNKSSVSNQTLLQLLVRVYNQSIQSYYYFPEVIICGHFRLEQNEFQLLLREGYIEPYFTDSFGKLYRNSKKAEDVLHENLSKRRHRFHPEKKKELQGAFPF